MIVFLMPGKRPRCPKTQMSNFGINFGKLLVVNESVDTQVS
jgi:hypothetical protein